MNVEEIGEFKLIELIHNTIGSDPGLLLGAGDDACAWETKNDIQLATTDCLVEGVHFQTDQASWGDLGYKALAVNLSDIAAMGGKGLVALVSLALPPDTQSGNIVSFYQEMLKLAKITGVAIGGGNISRSPVINITVTLIGATESPASLLKRSGACKGDLIAITGYPGSSAAGHMVLSGKWQAEEKHTAPLVQAFLRPYPRVAEGQILKTNGASAAIDISDGLLADLRHILNASSASAVIDTDKLPLKPLLKAGFSHQQALEFALSGGEDYELLFTASKEAIEKISAASSTSISTIGSIADAPSGSIKLIGNSAPLVDINLAGWKHFG